MYLIFQLVFFLMGFIFPEDRMAGEGFVEKAVSIQSSDVSLNGSLLLPTDSFSGPVALIIVGSGPTDRNGNQFFLVNNSLKMLAYGLAEQGIASLRYDKRGVLASIPENFREADLRFEDYISDAVMWLEWLKLSGQFSNIFVIGHSEGSLIGMMAARKAEISGFVSIAGAGRTAGDLIVDQLKGKIGVNQLDIATALIDSLENGHTIRNVPQGLQAIFRPSVEPYLISWMQYDPVIEVAKLEMPVMIIQGDMDLQVSILDARKLHRANPGSKLVIINNMNHVLKNIENGLEENRASYNDPTLPVSREVIAVIWKFIGE